MNLNPDQHYRYALDRQQRLWADAAKHRVADSLPARSRIARSLRRTADRLEATTGAQCPVCLAAEGC